MSLAPYFMRGLEKGGITSSILTDILRELDSREIFDYSKGRLPFILLDGHGSRTEFKFLKYINDPIYK